MGRGQDNTADELFYGALTEGAPEGMLAMDAIAEKNWPKLWELLRSYPELFSANHDILQEAASAIGQERVAEIFPPASYSDWPFVASALAERARRLVDASGFTPEDALSFTASDIVLEGISSSGPFGDVCRSYIDGRHLQELAPNLVFSAIRSSEQNKETLARPLARDVVTHLLPRLSEDGEASAAAGFCAGAFSALHLRSERDKTVAACGKEAFGYASAFYGAWQDAPRPGLERCRECLAKADADTLAVARAESSLDGGDRLPWSADEIAEVVQKVGLPALESSLGSQERNLVDDWGSICTFVVESASQELARKSL